MAPFGLQVGCVYSSAAAESSSRPAPEGKRTETPPCQSGAVSAGEGGAARRRMSAPAPGAPAQSWPACRRAAEAVPARRPSRSPDYVPTEIAAELISIFTKASCAEAMTRNLVTDQQAFVLPCRRVVLSAFLREVPDKAAAPGFYGNLMAFSRPDHRELQ